MGTYFYWDADVNKTSLKNRSTAVVETYSAFGNRISKTVTKPGSSITTLVRKGCNRKCDERLLKRR